MHKTTWFAIPIAGLAVALCGVGAWSYSVNQQRQALAADSEAQYAGAFHSLVSDMNNLTEMLGETEISTDASSFRAHAADTWRLSYAAQSNLSRLPFNLMPMHRTQAYLASLAKASKTWMTSTTTPTSPSVERQLHAFHSQSEALSGDLVKVQSQVLNDGMRWLAVNQALKNPKGDNQVIDGFRTMDSQAASFTETALGPTNDSRPARIPNTGQRITTAEAVQRVSRFAGTGQVRDWKVVGSKLGGPTPAYVVTGTVPSGSLKAVITKSGGRMLTFSVAHTSKSDNYGFEQAEKKAMTWARSHGFGPMGVETANQFHHMGYFVLAPVTKAGYAVVDAPISVHIALDTGTVVAYDGTAYYTHPMPQDVPTATKSVVQLRKTLNPQFRVETNRKVLVRDEAGRWRPAVEFDGTHDGAAYRVTLDANTGKELTIQHM